MVSDPAVHFRSSSITAQQNAVASGFGLGLLHHFSASPDPRLVPVLPEQIRIERAYWIILHADLRSLPRIRAVVDFLQSIVELERANLVGPAAQESEAVCHMSSRRPARRAN